MSLGNNVIPWVQCPLCKSTILLGPCETCGLSYGQARIKAGEDLCLCGAERCEPMDGTAGWNTLHTPRETCPPDRGVPGHS